MKALGSCNFIRGFGWDYKQGAFIQRNLKPGGFNMGFYGIGLLNVVFGQRGNS